ncbi:MAG: thiamine pyrophosphate-binding protein, partial [Verrucomicrobia bacterium]|nr:thiamine pyrophosphate-binding protein [Verrucomicrobiota bacterium]
MIRVADYIFRTLADRGVRHVFMVSGGGAMHLNDALGRESRLAYICNHHEQAGAMAAEGYARVTHQIGVACVTSGPGGINALNGIFGAWTDSIPVLVVSGQMKRETLLRTHGLLGRLRQLGDQEVDIVQMVEGITKYARMITEPSSIRYHLERALFLATHGRPGPVWLDVPVDVQAAEVNSETMPAYDPAEDAIVWDEAHLREQAAEVACRLRAAARPVLLSGTGVRLAGAIPEFRTLAERLQLPITTAWTHDLVPSNHPLFCGRQGTIGTRAGNFVVQ